MSDAARVRAARNKVAAVAVLALAGLQAGIAVGTARAQRPLRPGEGIEAVSPDSFRDGGASALLNAVLPPPPPAALPPPAAPCPEPPRCVPESDFSQAAWIVAGLSTAAMLVVGWWGVTQMRRTRIYREELSRIRIQRTSAIRTGRKLGEVQMPPHGLGKSPEAGDAAPASAPPPVVDETARPVMEMRPAAPFAAPRSEPPAAVASPAVRERGDARLAMAQAELVPLLRVVASIDEWFRSPEYQATLATAPTRNLLDRLHRGVVAASATLHALRQARIFPTTAEAIDDELERYWEQVYESLDDVHRLVAVASSDEGRRVLASTPGGQTVRVQLDRMLEAAEAYLASDGRRPIQTEPLVTAFDPRLHVAVESRHVDGVPAGRILAVVHCGIARDGRPLRKPAVVLSA